MAERLYQYGFDGIPHDVSPKGFKGVTLPESKEPETQTTAELGRFVRAVQETVRLITPDDAFQYFATRIFTPFDQFDQEELWVVLLNTKNQPTHEAMVYRGTINTIFIRPAGLYKPAVRVNAPAILISHCHPSGDPTPSPEDIHFTSELYQAGKLLSIDLLDHLIIGRDAYTSLKEKGLGFSTPTP